jgi:hypothetical protein
VNSNGMEPHGGILGSKRATVVNDSLIDGMSELRNFETLERSLFD